MVKINHDASHVAARIASQHPVMDLHAAKVEAALKANATKHRRTGDFARSIRTQTVTVASDKGVVVKDRYVYSDDPAALFIEYGHLQDTKDGPKKIPGTRIFDNTVRGLGDIIQAFGDTT